MLKMKTTLALLTLTGLISLSAHADPLCSKAPESQWQPLGKLRQQLETDGYQIKVLKKTKTGCYELYGKTKAGKRAEIYYNPVDLTAVKQEIED